MLWKHVFRNALMPIIAGFPAAFLGGFFTRLLLIETLFSLDGLGLLSYEKRDPPRLTRWSSGTLYLFTLIGLVTKLMSDLPLRLGGPACQVRTRILLAGPPPLGLPRPAARAPGPPGSAPRAACRSAFRAPAWVWAAWCSAPCWS